jgi:hypothetical protein
MDDGSIFTQPALQQIVQFAANVLTAPRFYGERYTPDAPTLGELWCCLCGSVPCSPCAPLLAYNAAGRNMDAVVHYCLLPCTAVYHDYT